MTRAADDLMLEMLAASGAQTPSARAVCREIAVGRPSPGLMFILTQAQSVEGASLVARSRGHAADPAMSLDARAWHHLRAELAAAAATLVGLDRAETFDAVATNPDLRAAVAAFDVLAGINGLAASAAEIYDRETGTRRRAGAELALGVHLLISAELDDGYTGRAVVKLANVHGVDLSSTRAMLRFAGVDAGDEFLGDALAEVFAQVHSEPAKRPVRRRPS